LAFELDILRHKRIWWVPNALTQRDELVAHTFLKEASCARISILPGNGIRVLSIDAGGVRCLCPLAILKKISEIIHESTETSLSVTLHALSTAKP